MTFYNEFSRHYETVFPFRSAVHDFLDHHLPERGRLLDIGCGPGRYCAALAGMNRSCLGTDLDPNMIAQARDLHPQGEFQILGMADLEKLEPGSFTGIFCVGNVLPHLPAGGLPGFLRSLKSLLLPGGIWVFQTVNFDSILDQEEYQFPVRDFPEQSLRFHRRYSGITEDRLVFSTRLDEKGREVFRGEVSLCPRSSGRLKDRHEAEGFRLLQMSGDFGGHPFVAETSGAVIGVYQC